jgi:hypothetical protein
VGTRVPIARFVPWLAPAALLSWYLLTYREGAVVGVPRLALWGSMLLAGAAGVMVLARWLALTRLAIPSRAAALAALTFGVVHYLVPATALQVIVAAVLLGASLLTGALIGLKRRWRLGAGSVVAAQAIAMWIVVDVAWIQTDVHVGERLQIFLLYDLKVYLAAGRNFVAGETVYLDHVMTALPAPTHDDFFLYPPVLLPVVAALASLARAGRARVLPPAAGRRRGGVPAHRPVVALGAALRGIPAGQSWRGPARRRLESGR